MRIYDGCSLADGWSRTYIAAMDDITPKMPTVRGFSFVYPRAVSGIKTSHKFFVVSTKMSRFSYTYAYSWSDAFDKSRFDNVEMLAFVLNSQL